MRVFEFVVSRFKNPVTVFGTVMSASYFKKSVSEGTKHGNSVNPALNGYSYYSGREWDFASVSNAYSQFVNTKNSAHTVYGNDLKHKMGKKTRTPFDVTFVRIIAANRREALANLANTLGTDLSFIVTHSAFDDEKKSY